MTQVDFTPEQIAKHYFQRGEVIVGPPLNGKKTKARKLLWQHFGLAHVVKCGEDQKTVDGLIWKSMY